MIIQDEHEPFSVFKQISPNEKYQWRYNSNNNNYYYYYYYSNFPTYDNISRDMANSLGIYKTTTNNNIIYRYPYCRYCADVKVNINKEMVIIIVTYYHYLIVCDPTGIWEKDLIGNMIVCIIAYQV